MAGDFCSVAVAGLDGALCSLLLEDCPGPPALLGGLEALGAGFTSNFPASEDVDESLLDCAELSLDAAAPRWSASFLSGSAGWLSVLAAFSDFAALLVAVAEADCCCCAERCVFSPLDWPCAWMHCAVRAAKIAASAVDLNFLIDRNLSLLNCGSESARFNWEARLLFRLGETLNAHPFAPLVEGPWL